MKHLDFLTSLKTIKSQLIQNKPKIKYTAFSNKEQISTPYCICTDSSGNTKYLYTTEKELDYLLSGKQTSLNTYPCPYEKGWHLTKR